MFIFMREVKCQMQVGIYFFLYRVYIDLLIFPNFLPQFLKGVWLNIIQKQLCYINPPTQNWICNFLCAIWWNRCEKDLHFWLILYHEKVKYACNKTWFYNSLGLLYQYIYIDLRMIRLHHLGPWKQFSNKLCIYALSHLNVLISKFSSQTHTYIQLIQVRTYTYTYKKYVNAYSTYICKYVC